MSTLHTISRGGCRGYGDISTPAPRIRLQCGVCPEAVSPVTLTNPTPLALCTSACGPHRELPLIPAWDHLTTRSVTGERHRLRYV